jgi:hypothetical protein
MEILEQIKTQWKTNEIELEYERQALYISFCCFGLMFSPALILFVINDFHVRGNERIVVCGSIDEKH